MTVFYQKEQGLKSEFDAESLRLLYAGYADHNETTAPTALHNHVHHFEMQYVSQGGANLRIGSRMYAVTEGDLIIYNMGELHDECANRDTGFCFYNCGIKGVKLKNLPEGWLLPSNVSPVIHTGEMAPAVLGIFQELFSQAEMEKPWREMVCKALLTALLTMVLHQLDHTELPEPDEKDRLFINIKDFIDNNFLQEYSIEELSDQFHMSPSGFSHQFKKRAGISPLQYIIRCRIGMAQKLLTTTDLSITEISVRCGFDNISYFNSQFKRVTTYSPQGFRKMKVGEKQFKKLDEICDWRK